MPKTKEFIAQAYIKLNGQNIAIEYMNRLISLEVDESLYLPDMFTLHFEDPGVALLQKDLFKPGAEIEIQVGTEDGTQSLIKGELTAVEPHLYADGRSTLMVRGYSR